MEKINLNEKLSLIREHWKPRIIAELNGIGPVACSSDEKFLAVGAEENMLTLWYLPALLD